MCQPSKFLATTVIDAKKKCDNMASCHMFFDGGFGIDYYVCEKTATVRHSTDFDYILWEKLSGNNKYMQYNIL